PVSGLNVGAVDDPAEHLADAMADTALERLRRATPTDPDETSEAHRHDAGCGHLRRSPAAAAPAGVTVGAVGGALDASTTERVEKARGGGAPLPTAVRSRIEAGFGRGLGHIRVHDGPE